MKCILYLPSRIASTVSQWTPPLSVYPPLWSCPAIYSFVHWTPVSRELISFQFHARWVFLAPPKPAWWWAVTMIFLPASSAHRSSSLSHLQIKTDSLRRNTLHGFLIIYCLCKAILTKHLTPTAIGRHNWIEGKHPAAALWTHRPAQSRQESSIHTACFIFCSQIFLSNAVQLSCSMFTSSV